MRVNNGFTADFLENLADSCIRERQLEGLYSQLSESDKDCINDMCQKLFVEASSGNGYSADLFYSNYAKDVSHKNVEQWFRIQGFNITYHHGDETFLTIGV